MVFSLLISGVALFFGLVSAQTSRLYPPTALTETLYTTLSRLAYGNGFYSLDMNTFSGNAGEEPLRAFDRDDSTYVSTPSNYDFSGIYTGSQSTMDKNSDVYGGEFIQIDLPMKIFLVHLEILPLQNISTGAKTSPKSFVLLGSAGDFSWEVVIGATDISWASLSSQSWSPIASTSRYSSFRLVVTSVVGGVDVSGPCEIAEILLYGHEYEIFAYPPAPLYSSSSSFDSSVATYGCCDYLLDDSGAEGGFENYRAFDQDSATDFLSLTYYNGGTGQHDCSIATTVQGEAYCGEYINILFPVSIFVTSIVFTPSANEFSTKSPRNWRLVASSDESGTSFESGNWNIVYEEVGYT